MGRSSLCLPPASVLVQSTRGGTEAHGACTVPMATGRRCACTKVMMLPLQWAQAGLKATVIALLADTSWAFWLLLAGSAVTQMVWIVRCVAAKNRATGLSVTAAHLLQDIRGT